MNKAVFTCAMAAGSAFTLPALGQAPPARDDLLVAISGGSLATVTLDGVSSIVLLDGGTLSMTLEGESACAALPTAGCPARINGIRLSTNDLVGLGISVDGDNETIDLRTPTSVLLGADPFVFGTFGFRIPDNDRAPTSSFAALFGEVSGEVFDGDAVTTGDQLRAPVDIDYVLVPNQLFSVDGVMPVEVAVGSSVITGTISFMAAGQAPFVNTPPLAFAGADTTLACGGSLTLDASPTIDLEGQDDIVAYRWFAPDGTLIASTATVTVTPALGPSTYRVEVEDESGGVGRDSILVTVTAGATTPQFNFVPADVFAGQCGAVSIGQAQASAACGGVTVTNNAPSSFFAGLTTVTWTASNPAGSVTATQRVFVELGDNPNCCPPGTNRILGNSNNNTLNGTTGRDCILAFGGQDTINGFGGDDIASGGDGDDVINVGSGNDVASAGPGQDRIIGESGNDFLAGNDGDDRLEGGIGNDTLRGGQGQDLLFAGAGADQCFGGTGDDQLFGEDGDDLLDGDENNNRCTGGAGFDMVIECVAQDVPESNGPPGFPGTPGYDVCDCRPMKCTDCTAQVNQCEAIEGCAPIVECIQATPNCNLPHECSLHCESGRSNSAVNAARQLASCFGGC